MTKKFKKITADKKKIYFFLIKNCNLPFPRPLQSMSRLQKKPAAHKRGNPTLQNMNFFSFYGSFLPSWIRIRIRISNTDPDPLARLNTDPIRIRIRNPAQNSRNQGLSYYFCIMIEGSGSRRPKNTWIRWIRIRNTA